MLYFLWLKILSECRKASIDLVDMNYRYWMKTMFDLEAIQRNQVNILKRVSRIEEAVF